MLFINTRWYNNILSLESTLEGNMSGLWGDTIRLKLTLLKEH